MKISFLSPKTEDMDIVDVLRPKCGPIIHAKIMREKQLQYNKKGKSKGWALVQFEERESVENALALSDIIGIQMKSVRIERSHLPAIGLVPAGLHRVNPKGEGKSTKRNLLHKRKEHQQRDPQSPKGAVDATAKPQHQDSSSTKGQSNKVGPEKNPTAVGGGGAGGAAKSSLSTTSIFAFRPRGVTSSNSQKRKAKISLSSSEHKKLED